MLVLFMHFCAAVLCFVTQRFSSSIVGTRHLLWRQNNRLGAQGIGPPYTYSHFVLSRKAPFRCVTRQTKTVVMLSDWLPILFLRWYVMDAKLCHYSLRGAQSHLNKLCSQSKGRDIIFHLKKKNAKEVIFAFKIFYKIFVEEHDSFCGLTLRGKSGLEFKDFKYRTL